MGRIKTNYDSDLLVCHTAPCTASFCSKRRTVLKQRPHFSRLWGELPPLLLTSSVRCLAPPIPNIYLFTWLPFKTVSRLTISQVDMSQYYPTNELSMVTSILPSLRTIHRELFVSSFTVDSIRILEFLCWALLQPLHVGRVLCYLNPSLELLHWWLAAD